MKPPRNPPRPAREQLLAAAGKGVPDIIAHGLGILFCGINPGLYSGAVGHHFARPGNRFWPALHAAKITGRLLSPYDERQLLEFGCGITNIVDKATATASELSREELEQGALRLARKVKRYKPEFVAILGVTAYRTAFGGTDAELGEQEEKIGTSKIWILPNPSGLNAHYQLKDLARLFRKLEVARRGAV
ncbi:MAG TPA: G/U mismatch-specific DNA glycosylase [Blastocatellia bacterium]